MRRRELLVAVYNEGKLRLNPYAHLHQYYWKRKIAPTFSQQPNFVSSRAKPSSSNSQQLIQIVDTASYKSAYLATKEKWKIHGLGVSQRGGLNFESPSKPPKAEQEVSRYQEMKKLFHTVSEKAKYNAQLTEEVIQFLEQYASGPQPTRRVNSKRHKMAADYANSGRGKRTPSTSKKGS
jgi:hypothetical protein